MTQMYAYVSYIGDTNKKCRFLHHYCGMACESSRSRRVENDGAAIVLAVGPFHALQPTICSFFCELLGVHTYLYRHVDIVMAMVD
jgi:hypothetical protein